MSNLPFARRYWNRLTSAVVSDGSQPAGRGQRGYTFGQRYWAAFVGFDLPVRKTNSSRSTGSLWPAPAVQKERPGIAPAPDAPAPGEEVDELLGRIRDAVPSPANPICAAETRNLAIHLAATPEQGSFTVAVSITAKDGLTAGTGTLALEEGGVYFVAPLTVPGAVTFRQVPGGEWDLWRIQGRPGRAGWEPGLALPLPRRREGLAAAGRGRGTIVVTAVLPDAEARLTLHRERQGDYLVEIDRVLRTEAPLVIAVRYGTEDGSEALVVVPARGSGLARLDGFSPASPWQVSPVPAASLATLGPDSIAASVRAAVSNETRRAWHEIRDVTPEIRTVIDTELGEVG